MQILREHTVIAFKSLTEGNLRIRRVMTTFNHGRGTSQNLLGDFHNSGSNAVKKIDHYTNSYALPTSKLLVKKPDGIQFPQNPCNGYIIKWYDGFSGCLEYGTTIHQWFLALIRVTWTLNDSTRKGKIDPIPRELTPLP